MHNQTQDPSETSQGTELTRLQQRALKDFSPSIWQRIAAAYSEPHRHYHGISHLTALFQEYDRHHSALHYPLAVRIAIWFHDYRYDVDPTLYPSNETRSAQALDALDLNDWKQIELAAAFIRFTKGHAADIDTLHGDSNALADAHLFLDMDLAILSAPPAICDRYDENIRREFAGVPEAVFATARAHALRAFLARERIYFSDAFGEREQPARQNLARLIDRWDAVAANGAE